MTCAFMFSRGLPPPWQSARRWQLISPAMAEMVKMMATLDATQEVPPNDSAGKGTADVTFDTENKKLDWTIEYSGLTGEATAAHFHGPAAMGDNAGVAVPIEDAKSGAEGYGNADRRAGGRPGGRQILHQHSHRGSPGR